MTNFEFFFYDLKTQIKGTQYEQNTIMLLLVLVIAWFGVQLQKNHE